MRLFLLQPEPGRAKDCLAEWQQLRHANDMTVFMGDSVLALNAAYMHGLDQLYCLEPERLLLEPDGLKYIKVIDYNELLSFIMLCDQHITLH